MFASIDTLFQFLLHLLYTAGDFTLLYICNIACPFAYYHRILQHLEDLLLFSHRHGSRLHKNLIRRCLSLSTKIVHLRYRNF